jgi:hypothetical protein
MTNPNNDAMPTPTMAAAALFIPVDLHHATGVAVRDFARVVGEKLYAAQVKYGYTNNWQNPGWVEECRIDLLRHVHKGDPVDVAAYCMFLWWHNASTTPAYVRPNGRSPAAVPAGYMYGYRNRLDGQLTWRHRSGTWNGIEPAAVKPYFFDEPHVGGFLIQHASRPLWRTLDTAGMPDWTGDPAQALRIGLKKHAMAFALDDPEDVQIVLASQAVSAGAAA